MKNYRKYFLAWLFLAGILLSSCTFAISTNINLPTPTSEMTQTISNPVATDSVSSGCKKIAFAILRHTV